jgi:putative membrane protein
MIRYLVGWLLNALALLVAAYIVPGIELEGYGTAMVAALVIGLLNITLGAMLRFVTWPLNWLSLGLVFLFVYALILYIASKLVRGFRVRGLFTALLGALVLAMLHAMIDWLGLLG